MVNKEQLINAYMQEYELAREDAEVRADKAIERAQAFFSSDSESDEEGQEELWTVSEVMCCKCFERWLAVRPESTLLKDLECPRCKFTGATIETGQEFYSEEIDDLLDNDEDDEE